MERTQAIIQGIKKPCDHEFDRFQVYKFEWESVQYSTNMGKAIAQMICKTGKKRKNKRWLSDCPVCGKMWFADSSKNGVLADIKAMGKKYKIILTEKSIRKGQIIDNKSKNNKTG